MADVFNNAFPQTSSATAPTLEVVNKYDGTADFILGSVGGSVKVYASKYTDSTFPVNELFSASTNGTTNVPLDSGPYIAIATSGSGSSDPVMFRVSNGETGLAYEVLQTFRNHLISLSLESFPTDPDKYRTYKRPKNSFKELLEANDGSTKNVLGVHIWLREEERPLIATNSERDLTFVVEYVLVKSNQLNNFPDSNWTYDREKVFRSFGSCPLSGVEEVYSVNCYPGTLYQTDETMGIDANAMQVHFTARIAVGSYP